MDCGTGRDRALPVLQNNKNIIIHSFSLASLALNFFSKKNHGKITPDSSPATQSTIAPEPPAFSLAPFTSLAGFHRSSECCMNSDWILWDSDFWDESRPNSIISRISNYCKSCGKSSITRGAHVVEVILHHPSINCHLRCWWAPPIWNAVCGQWMKVLDSNQQKSSCQKAVQQCLGGRGAVSKPFLRRETRPTLEVGKELPEFHSGWLNKVLFTDESK